MHHILVIGSGGREHALCWKINQSPLSAKLYCAPGNGGIGMVAECVELKTDRAIIKFCKKNNIDLVVIGPEQPLVDGLADKLRKEGIAVFGPSQAAARLEGSKAFTKQLCDKYHIPTAAYGEFTDATEAKTYLQGKPFPQVIKADGLAAGKGVIIAENLQMAQQAIDDMFGGAFGKAGKKIVIEEFLEGEELSFFALSDGNAVLEFGTAQDHKRAFDGDTGPNTGGMGTYSPPPIATPTLREQIMREIILPTIDGMKREGCPFQGVLFAGLMLTKDGAKLLEYNTRFGDPETQVLMARLSSDLVPLLVSCANGTLDASTPIHYKQEAALCVVMASVGYPGDYQKGTEIRCIEQASAIPNVLIFHAGTVRDGDRLKATGGRVLGVTALGTTLADAQERAYRSIDLIDWPEGFCRRDIGWRAVA